jgi:hypothetical protein
MLLIAIRTLERPSVLIKETNPSYRQRRCYVRTTAARIQLGGKKSLARRRTSDKSLVVKVTDFWLWRTPNFVSISLETPVTPCYSDSLLFTCVMRVARQVACVTHWHTKTCLPRAGNLYTNHVVWCVTSVSVIKITCQKFTLHAQTHNIIGKLCRFLALAFLGKACDLVLTYMSPK